MIRAVRIVDDEPIIGEMLSTLLSLEGIPNTVTSQDFDTLLAPERWEGITTALVDLNLSEDVSGEDVLAYLKEHHPNIRRIVLSAITDTADVKTRLGGLAHAVLTKPSEIVDILTEVQRG